MVERIIQACRAETSSLIVFGRSACLIVMLSILPSCGDPSDREVHGLETTAKHAALDAAETYWRSGDFPKAEAILAVLLERDPLAWEAHEMLAQVLIARAGDDDEAGLHVSSTALREEAYGHLIAAIERAPNADAPHQAAGVLAAMLQRPVVALAHFEAALELDPAHVQAALYAAQMAMSIGRHDRAGELIDRTLRIVPDEPYALATLAVIRAESGDAKGARQAIDRAVGLSPGESALRVQQARVMRRLGDSRRAAEILLLLPDAERRRVPIALALAEDLRTIDEHARAARVLVDAVRADPVASGWQLPLAAAEAMAAGGQVGEARLWLERAIAAGAPDDRVRQTRDRISDFAEEAPGSEVKG